MYIESSTYEENKAGHKWGDEFEFCDPKEKVRKQIGMAVPPQGMKIIFDALLKTLAGIKYDSIKNKV